VVALDADYRVAVVSDRDRKNLWILSREPDIKPAAYRALVDELRERGFPAHKLVRTLHDADTTTALVNVSSGGCGAAAGMTTWRDGAGEVTVVRPCADAVAQAPRVVQASSHATGDRWFFIGGKTKPVPRFVGVGWRPVPAAAGG
jgi:hypothetical protein